MQTVHYVILDNGDGSQSVEWYRGVTYKELEEFCEKDEYDSYQSGDGIQITQVSFPDSVNLDDIVGIHWNFGLTYDE